MENRNRIFDSNTSAEMKSGYKNITEISENLRELKLIVDCRLEYKSIYEDMFLMSEVRVKELFKQQLGENVACWQPDAREKRLTENKHSLAMLEALGNINIKPYEHNVPIFGEVEAEPFPLINVLSGSEITIPCGEGILDFIYADFESGYESSKSKTQNDTAEPENNHEYKNIMERNISEHIKLLCTMDCFGALIYSSVYSAAFPPIMSHRTANKLLKYYNYLKSLQKRLLELLEFCFDENFYPNVLGGKNAIQRYALYCRVNNIDNKIIRNEIFEVKYFKGKNLPKYTTISDVFKDNEDKPLYKDFCERYNIRSIELDAILGSPATAGSFYECTDLESILELELIGVMKYNIRFRKCKRCGKYFIMKGNYDTNYCSRITEGETRNCQDLAALENYKKKTANNAAIPIYSKYYKRYAARVRVNQIKESEFKKWKYEAMTKRDQCSDEKISLQEYINWLEGCFPNRQKR